MAEVFGPRPHGHLSAFESSAGEVQLQTDLKEVTSSSPRCSRQRRLEGEAASNFAFRKRASIASVMNYPNPMRGNTCFAYELSQPAEVTIKIYTISGRLIQVLNDYSECSSIPSNGTDAIRTRPIANGVYLYKVIAKAANQSKK
jgi:hypothetical protein